MMKESDGEVIILFVSLSAITIFVGGLWALFQISVWLPVAYCAVSVLAMGMSLHASHTDKDWDDSERANMVACLTAVTLGMYWPLFCLWVLLKYVVYLWEFDYSCTVRDEQQRK